MEKILATSLLLASGSVFAGSGALSSVDAADAAPELSRQEQIDAKKDDWTSGFHGMVGIAAINMPTWPGVDEQETIGAPLINVHWKDTVYFEYNKIGGWLFKNDDKTFRVGLVARQRMGCDKGDCNIPGYEVDAYSVAGVRAKTAAKIMLCKIILYNRNAPQRERKGIQLRGGAFILPSQNTMGVWRKRTMQCWSAHRAQKRGW